MALSTVKINDTIEWARKMTFGRNSAISNSLEPALSSANMIMQTILGPPFSWWWNNEDLVFTANPTLVTASLTNIAITSNVVTITVPNSYAVGQEVIPSAIVTATFLNGQILTLLTATATNLTATFKHADYASAPDTGTLTAATSQDYTVAASEFSHIDYAAVQDINQTPAKWFELGAQDHLSLDSVKARPQYINPQSQDASGNITFRLMPAPDKAYPVVVNIMKAAPILTSVNSTWAPIPDYMQYVYNWGFLALMFMFSDDPRFAFANSKFTGGLLARSQGLSEQERNIFLNNWNELTGHQQSQQAQGMQARAV